jgi:hypothetical protein
MQETDPDTLQLLDETDKKWVNQWHKALKKPKANKLEFFVEDITQLKTQV